RNPAGADRPRRARRARSHVLPGEMPLARRRGGATNRRERQAARTSSPADVERRYRSGCRREIPEEPVVLVVRASREEQLLRRLAGVGVVDPELEAPEPVDLERPARAGEGRDDRARGRIDRVDAPVDEVPDEDRARRDAAPPAGRDRRHAPRTGEDAAAVDEALHERAGRVEDAERARTRP